MRWVLSLAIAAVTASSAVAQPQGATNPPQAVSFARLAARIQSGTPWAHIQRMDVPFGCKDLDVIAWSEKDNAALQNMGFEQVFRSSLGSAGFRVAGDPTNLFEEDHKTTDLQVGALVTRLDAKFCQTHTLKDSLVN